MFFSFELFLLFCFVFFFPLCFHQYVHVRLGPAKSARFLIKHFTRFIFMFKLITNFSVHFFFLSFTLRGLYVLFDSSCLSFFSNYVCFGVRGALLQSCARQTCQASHLRTYIMHTRFTYAQDSRISGSTQ